MLRAVVAQLPEIVFVKDANGRYLLANPAAAKNAGAASSAELLGKTDSDFFPKEIAQTLFENDRKILESGMAQSSLEDRATNAEGRIRHLLTKRMPWTDCAGNTLGLFGLGREITEQNATEIELERAREQLAFITVHDTLTSLMNRSTILERLDMELSRSVREQSSNAVLLADLDGFETINGVHGHLVGDEVLEEVGRRLIKSVRDYDLVGRYGGEEFLVVLPGCSDASAAMARAEQLRDAVASAPIQTAHGAIPVTMSVGVLVVAWDRHASAVDVILDVEAALHEARKAGRNRCRFASPATAVVAG